MLFQIFFVGSIFERLPSQYQQQPTKKCTPYAMYTNTWNHGKHHMCARCEFRCVLCNGITHHKLAVKTVHSC